MYKQTASCNDYARFCDPRYRCKSAVNYWKQAHLRRVEHETDIYFREYFWQHLNSKRTYSGAPHNMILVYTIRKKPASVALIFADYFLFFFLITILVHLIGAILNPSVLLIWIILLSIVLCEDATFGVQFKSSCFLSACAISLSSPLVFIFNNNTSFHHRIPNIANLYSARVNRIDVSFNNFNLNVRYLKSKLVMCRIVLLPFLHICLFSIFFYFILYF